VRQFQEMADIYSRDAIFFNEQDALLWLFRQRFQKAPRQLEKRGGSASV
jgi:hypothetical protein